MNGARIGKAPSTSPFVYVFNQIVVLERGRIVEHGSHSTLSVRPGGLYARLCALQSNGRFAELPV
jgi:ABC-type transport system involved in cytochrome bd biosynthesis fused ATPase/permease subunit